MVRTVLFFGDSNTRGFGVLPKHRYAAVLERSLEPRLKDRWQFAVASSPSDLRVIGEKLEAALKRHNPDLLVVQCPIGPASYFIKYPRWLNWLRTLPARHLRWHTERAIEAEIDTDPTHQRTRRDALRDGIYVDSAYSFRLGNWAVFRALRAAAARRYGLIAKATGERYLKGMLELRATARTHMQGPILFLGLLKVSESLYPGYHRRACDWNSELAKQLLDSPQRCFFVDAMEALAAVSRRELLLNDDTHLSINGHRHLAELLLPDLRRLIEDTEPADVPESSRGGC